MVALIKGRFLHSFTQMWISPVLETSFVKPFNKQNVNEHGENKTWEKGIRLWTLEFFLILVGGEKSSLINQKTLLFQGKHMILPSEVLQIATAANICKYF